MNNVDKTLLLAEKFGADVSFFTSSYVEAIIRSPSYVKLVENVNWADNFPLRKAVALKDDFKSINYDVKSFEESVILSSRINYLFAVSEESFYLNPLFSYDVKPKTKSIGDLMVDYNGKNHTFNELISDKTRNMSYKGSVIAKKVDSYRLEMNEFLDNIYGKTRQRKGISSIVRRVMINFSILFVIAALGVMLDIYMLVSNKEMFTSVFSVGFNFTSFGLGEYGIFIFFYLALCYFFFTCILGARINYVFAPYYYFKNFGRNKANKVYTRVNNKAQKLADYIFDHCKKNEELKDDISLFTMPKKYNSELDSYLKCYSIKKDRFYRFLKSISTFFLVLMILDGIYYLVVFLLKMYGVI